MQVSLSWLSTHLDLSSYTTAQLSDLLTFAGVEVEGIEEKGVTTDKVVVAQIQSFVQHPNADKLSVCQVDDGSGTTRQIVCGAKNFKAGDKVPLALPGAVLPGGFAIKEGKLRGVDSMGMMCSGKELGLGDDHSGLLIMAADSPIGTPFNQLNPADVLFDLEITPNRPDLLSHLGLARELAALTGLPLKGQRDYTKTTTKLKSDATVKLEAKEACPLYTARLIKGVKVGPSPEWLRRRLESIGLRPINSIVDITNFVMMEMGQSLHCFDFDKLPGGICVRMASEGEKIVALDGQTYALQSDDLVIADGRPIAIAGVMGGEETGVTESTVNVLLESAYFAPSGIRRTSRRLGLSSDSSYRFERGIDPQQVQGGSEFATKLILSIAGGTPEEVTFAVGEAPALVGEVTLDENRARKLLGTPDITGDKIHAILEKLGLTKKSANKHESHWLIPSYRLDLQRPVDLIEELARVIGLDRVPSRQVAVASPVEAADRTYDFSMTLRQSLTSRGFFEAQTLRLIATAQLPDSLGAADATSVAVAVKNPLSEDHTTLRPSIVPGLIATAALNIRQGLHRLRFFELGRVFLKLPNGSSREEERLAILLSGPVSPSSWHGREPQAADIHELVGQIQNLTRTPIEVRPAKENAANFLLTSELRAGNRVLGWTAQLHPSRARDIDARHPVYVAELLLSALRQGSTGPTKFEELPRFPGMTRDVAMEVPADLPHAKVAAFFAAQKHPLFIGAEVFDIFTDPTGTKIASDRKSIAWTLTYRASDKTLETAEVDAAHTAILTALEKTLPAKVRG